MAKVRKKAKTGNAAAEKFASRIYKVDIEQARNMHSSYSKVLKVEMKRLRIKGQGGRKPFRITMTLQWNDNKTHEWWKHFDDLGSVRVYFQQSYGATSELLALEHLGLSALNWKPPGKSGMWQTSAWSISDEWIKGFKPHFNAMKERFFEDSVLAYAWPKGWKPHGSNRLPLKVFHAIDAFDLVNDIRKLANPNAHFVSFRFDNKGKSLGIMVKNATTQGVNTETLELMNKIDEEVKKHRTANNSLHQS